MFSGTQVPEESRENVADRAPIEELNKSTISIPFEPFEETCHDDPMHKVYLKPSRHSEALIVQFVGQGSTTTIEQHRANILFGFYLSEVAIRPDRTCMM